MMNNHPSREAITDYFRTLQDDICTALEQADGGGAFREDTWQRPGGGGGRSRVLSGAVIEKGGVNFSAVHGSLPDRAAQALRLAGAGDFYATGVSIVLHPRNPEVPIIHMNVRYFAMSDGTWWFGGGIDLTPHYVDPVQAGWFHEQLQRVCADHHPDYYPRFKREADDYFYLRHRRETRGVGGIFYDRLGADSELDKTALFAFTRSVGDAFAPIYTHLMAQNKDKPYGEREVNWQHLRRGRYVEFNLVWDRGTKFGLETDGRTESILMSLPPLAGWVYNYEPEPGSREAKTLGYLRKGIDWLGAATPS
jgi:coproporphyrinogen III oxidase